MPTTNRQELENYISEIYGVDAEYPWIRYPSYTVYRHKNNNKWFAVIMQLPKTKLGLVENEIIDVMNLKCDPLLIGSLLNEKGFFPAYHMNKANWITLSLDASVTDDKIKWLINISFELTKKKRNGYPA